MVRLTARRARAQFLREGRSARAILIGRVHSVDGLVATIEINGGRLTLPTLGLTLAAGDIVNALADNNRITAILGRLGYSADLLQVRDATEGPTAPPRARRGSAVPRSTGTYRGGWLPTTDMAQGRAGGFGRSTGAAFYGDQIAGLHALPGSAGAFLTIRRAAGTVGPEAVFPRFWLVTERVQPAGPPTRTLTSFGPQLVRGQTATWEVPGPWVAEFIAGTAGGIALHIDLDTPPCVLDGQRTFAASMALSIHYER